MSAVQAIQELHDRCAVYTSSATAARLLDTIGWTSDADLSSSVLLEPCVGEGAILLEAAVRLLASFRNAGRRLARQRLAPRIKGFEFHGKTAAEARRALERVLLNANVSWPSARALSHTWVRERDFLLETPGKATHVAANPPYIRWGKLPVALAEKYRAVLPESATRGDLAVAFLDRMLAWSKPSARVVALTSDRWMFAQYGVVFQRQFEKLGWHFDVVDPRPDHAFVRRVGAYSAIVSFVRHPATSVVGTDSRSLARAMHGKLVAQHGMLAEAGCIVRVGPALGCGETFLVSQEEAEGIEDELIRPFVPRAGAETHAAVHSQLRVVAPYDRLGLPIIFDEWPGFVKWARKPAVLILSESH